MSVTVQQLDQTVTAVNVSPKRVKNGGSHIIKYQYSFVLEDGSQVKGRLATRHYKTAFFYDFRVCSGANGLSAFVTMGKAPASYHKDSVIGSLPITYVPAEIVTSWEQDRSFQIWQLADSQEGDALRFRIRSCSEFKGEHWKHYQHVATIGQTNSLKDVFHIGNGYGDQGKLFREPGASMYSLSVGDIVTSSNGEAWICCPFGWEEIQVPSIETYKVIFGEPPFTTNPSFRVSDIKGLVDRFYRERKEAGK